jgi:hypothetical protein
VEIICLWILPIIYVYLLLRYNVPIRQRLGWLVLMIIGIGAAEAVGIYFMPRGAMPGPMTAWEWYSYRSVYSLVGIIQLCLLIPLIAIVSSRRMNAILANGATGLLLIIYGWLTTSALADYRPLLLSKQLPLIILIYLFVASIYYLIFNLRLNRPYSIILSVLITAIFILPTVYSSNI